MAYATLPFEPTFSVKPFKIHVPDADLQTLNTLLRVTKIPKATFENTQTKDNFGVTREWMVNTKRYWESGRAQERRINEIPQFIASVKTDHGVDYSVHLMALFSKRKDAIPILLSHGWPGCFYEFLPMMELVKKTWSEDDLPYHLVVPSQPGYMWSQQPDLDQDWNEKRTAYVFNNLMKGLGFNKYLAQGGDTGSIISLEIGETYDECPMIHLNFRKISSPPAGTKDAENLKKPPSFRSVLDQLQQFGYNLEHATRPSTVGFTVGSNPISLLAWVGEKYIEWSDQTPSIDTILTIISLYWFTDTYPSSIALYRWSQGTRERAQQMRREAVFKVPAGYSLFKHELAPTPVEWVEKVNNIIWSRVHEDGGHFAALEKPEVLFDDVQDFLKKHWK